MKNTRNGKGFALVEVIMGISIAAIVLISLMDAYYNAMSAIHKAGKNQQAVNIAQGYAEEMLNMEEDALISTYSSYESEEGDYRVSVELEIQRESTANKDVCIGEIKRDVLIEIGDEAVLINGFEMPVQENMEVTIEESEKILVKPYGIGIEGIKSGTVVIWQRGCADIERIHVKNSSIRDIDVYHFKNPAEGFNEIAVEGQNVCIQENMGDFKTGTRLLRARICVYCNENLEAEIVTYRNVRY